jgi:hypothetical protein
MRDLVYSLRWERWMYALVDICSLWRFEAFGKVFRDRVILIKKKHVLIGIVNLLEGVWKVHTI